MPSFDSSDNLDRPFNTYFFLAIGISVISVLFCGYAWYSWFNETIQSHFLINRQIDTMQQSYRFSSFSCDALLYDDDLLLRKISNDFLPVADNYVPGNLVAVPKSYVHPRVGTLMLRSDVLPSVTEMIDAARRDGFDLRINSSYRSFTQQKELYEYSTGVLLITQPEKAARPGFSEHQLGAAIDISAYPDSGDAGYAWLADHGHEFGFVISYPDGAESQTGYQHEPWHWRFVGHEIAQYIHDYQVLFAKQKALILPSPLSPGTELPYEYQGRDIWAWKSQERGNRFETLIRGVLEYDYFSDIPLLVQKLDHGYAQSHNSFVLSRSWILERDTEIYTDTQERQWLRTSFASPNDEDIVERIEILYRGDIGYLIVNYQNQTYADRIIKEYVRSCDWR